MIPEEIITETLMAPGTTMHFQSSKHFGEEEIPEQIAVSTNDKENQPLQSEKVGVEVVGPLNPPGSTIQSKLSLLKKKIEYQSNRAAGTVNKQP